jgi:hypothetical protein
MGFKISLNRQYSLPTWEKNTYDAYIPVWSNGGRAKGRKRSTELLFIKQLYFSTNNILLGYPYIWQEMTGRPVWPGTQQNTTVSHASWK